MPEKTKRRRQINLREPKKTTVIKNEIPATQPPPIPELQTQVRITSYPKQTCGYNEKEIQEMGKISDSLVFFEAYAYSIMKQQLKISEFLQQNSPFVRQVFKKAFMNLQKKLAQMKESKIQMMDGQDIEYVRPDKDIFVACKSQKISQMMTLMYHDHQKMNQFPKMQTQFQNRISSINDAVAKRSQVIEQIQVIQHFQPLEEKIVAENEQKLQKEADSLKRKLLQMVSAQQKMLEIENKFQKNCREEKLKFKIQAKEELYSKWKSSPRVFALEDYLTLP